jgi:hypothetical protein
MADSLEARVQRLEDERDVLDTLYAYIHTFDNGPIEAFVDCFTEDCYLKWPDPEPDRYGHEGIREAYLKNEPRPPARVRKHTVLSPRITVDGDTAHVFSYYSTLNDNEGFGPRMITMGTYEDELVRGEDGKWRFKSRVTIRQSKDVPRSVDK